MKTILHKNDNSETILTHIAEGHDISSISSQLGGCQVDLKDIDLNYITAYKIENNKPVLDLEKVRSLKVEQIRNQRDEAFFDFDRRYDIALKDESDLSLLKQERQQLKDAPQKAEVYLDSCVSLQEMNVLNIDKVM
ncbi:MAG TPA: hypothetical protein DCL21_06275 [Alphaproteobacteria bacterium]|nr:hypothetical protein [Alphaproteobacteria bacterium]